MPEAFAIGAYGTAVKFFSFMVPASLGALEGGNVAIFAAFDMGGAVALTYTLVRRLREILWVAAGFLASSVVSLASPVPADQEERPARRTSVCRRRPGMASLTSPAAVSVAEVRARGVLPER